MTAKKQNQHSKSNTTLSQYEYVLIAPEYIRILSYKSMNKVWTMCKDTVYI